MYIITTLEPNLESAKLVEPGAGSLNYPAVLAQPLAGVPAASGDPNLDASHTYRTAMRRIVVSLVGMQLLRPLSGSTTTLLYRLNCVQHRLKHLNIVRVGRRYLYSKWNPAALYHKMALRARFASIRRIRAGFTAPRGAATQNESTLARLQSIWSCWPNLSRSTWWSFLHTPASCQSRSLLQHVTPEPHPNSSGSIFHGMPLLSTKIMPVKTALFDTLGRPALVFLGGSGGSNGPTTDHSSSVTRTLGITYKRRYRKTALSQF